MQLGIDEKGVLVVGPAPTYIRQSLCQNSHTVSIGRPSEKVKKPPEAAESLICSPGLDCDASSESDRGLRPASRPFGRYTLVDRLATGGMAEVFKARIDAAHGFQKGLVIKRILPHLAEDKNFVSMFIDEAKLTAQLAHPKIVQVTDFGEVDGQYFIALEFIDGFDALALLRTGAKRQTRLPVPLAAFIATEILDALDYAHNARDAQGREMNLVHRDISPANVFISHRGDVKLGDFGIAHAADRESKTSAGTLKGKYGYMSPEQVVGKPLDGRSDVFAVGVVLAEMLMGRRLFTSPNELDVLLMVRDGRLERFEKYCPPIPDHLQSIVRKALAKDRDARYPDAAAFRDDLAEFLFSARLRISPSDLGGYAAAVFSQAANSQDNLEALQKRWALPDIQAIPDEQSPQEPAAKQAPTATEIDVVDVVDDNDLLEEDAPRTVWPPNRRLNSTPRMSKASKTSSWRNRRFNWTSRWIPGTTHAKINGSNQKTPMHSGP